MASIAMVLPILPGKLEAWRRFCAEFQGARREEYVASRRRMAVTTERADYQQTPQGDLAVVYFEATDIGQVLEAFGSSQEPFDVWFREQVVDVHGVDLSQPLPGPLPELVVDSHL